MPTAHLFAFNSTIAAELKERLAKIDDQGRDAFSTPIRYTPSKHQKAFFKWLSEARGSCILKAVAGSGKTTSIVTGLRFVPGLTVRDVRASTFHSVGFNALCKKLGNFKIKPDANKVRKIAKLALTERELDLYEAFAVKLVALAKGEGLGAIAAGTETTWQNLVSHHDLSLDSEEASEEEGIQIARRLLRLSNDLARPLADRKGELFFDGAPTEPTIDFDDMLYIPLLWKCRLQQDDLVVIDEAQDTNPVRRAIAKLKLRPGGRLIAVGDPRQAIYGFTGASADALDLIAKEFSCVELPLTVSYRCPTAVAERVRALVPYFEVPEGAATGSVKALTMAEALPFLSKDDCIVCRQTAPLVSLALSLIATGTPCHVLGREIGTGLVNLVKRLGSRGMERFLAKLEAYREREKAKHVARGEELKAAGVEDRVDCILAVVDALPENERTVPGLTRRIESLFSDDGGSLSLATVHKVKGKEYGVVAVLMPELMPSKWARQLWQRAQEENLIYVAWTRAQRMLIDLTTSVVPRTAVKKLEVVS